MVGDVVTVRVLEEEGEGLLVFVCWGVSEIWFADSVTTALVWVTNEPEKVQALRMHEMKMSENRRLFIFSIVAHIWVKNVLLSNLLNKCNKR